MVKKVIILLGVRESGKTLTLRRLFNVAKRKIIGKTIIDGKEVPIKGFGSPQEMEEFCNVKNVIKNIKRRIKHCEKNSKGKDYVLVIPFSLMKRKKRTNEDCIIKPIEWLKNHGFSVHVIYLRKLTFADKLATKAKAKTEIKSDENYSRQSKELKEFIKQM